MKPVTENIGTKIFTENTGQIPYQPTEFGKNERMVQRIEQNKTKTENIYSTSPR